MFDVLSVYNNIGEDIMIHLLHRGMIVSNFDTITYRQNACYNFEAFEKKHTLFVDFEALQSILKTNSKFESNRTFF